MLEGRYMAEHSLLDLYSYAQDGEAVTDGIQYHNARIGVQTKENGLVYVWGIDARDEDEMFDTSEIDPREFEEEVERWVKESGLHQ